MPICFSLFCLLYDRPSQSTLTSSRNPVSHIPQPPAPCCGGQKEEQCQLSPDIVVYLHKVLFRSLKFVSLGINVSCNWVRSPRGGFALSDPDLWFWRGQVVLAPEMCFLTGWAWGFLFWHHVVPYQPDICNCYFVVHLSLYVRMGFSHHSQVHRGREMLPQGKDSCLPPWLLWLGGGNPELGW